MTSPQDLPGMVNQLRIIVAAMVMGIVMFAGIAVFQGASDVPESPLITYLMLGMALMAIVARAIVPGLIVTNNLRQLPDDAAGRREKLLGLYRTSTIIAAALLEGAALANLMAYFLEGQILSLVVAGVVAGLLLMLIPSQRGVEDWIERQIRRATEPR